ncbi:MAG: alpha-amylase family protein [Spirochaetales bacterium]|nr:alpha-amylase family protein [Spirochaetales bacterium]
MHHSIPRLASAVLRRFFIRQEAAAADVDFVVQLSTNFFDLYQLFRELYGSRIDWNVHFDRLLDTLFGAWSARPATLRRTDKERVDRGAWYADGSLIAMQLYVDRFAGTLENLRGELDYFSDLGVNALHVMPLLKTPDGDNDGGYAVSDYGAVQPELGTMADLTDLAAALHERDMVLILDYVLNHTSDSHEWARRARSGEPAYQDYYYMYPDRSVPDLFDEYLPEVFPETAPGNFTYVREIDRWAMTVFHDYQWDLNYANPNVFIEMAAILLELANRGVDILRFDAVPYLWKQLGTTGQNLPCAHTLVRLFNACARVAAPGIAFVAEAIVQPVEIARYFGEGRWEARECELAYNASLMVLLWDALATGRSALVSLGLSHLPRPPADTAWLNYVRCHDDIGLGYDETHLRMQGWDPAAHRDFMIRYYTGEFPGSTARGAKFMYNPSTGDARISGTAASLAGIEVALESGDESLLTLAIDRHILLHALILGLDGVPVIYAGDEIGRINDYTYADDPATAADNRWMHRPHISRADRARRARVGTVEQRIFSRLSDLIAARRGCPALAGNGRAEVASCDNPHILGLVRTGRRGSRALILANFDSHEQFVPATLLAAAGFSGGGLDVVRATPVVPGRYGLSLPPYGYVWMTLDRAGGR